MRVVYLPEDPRVAMPSDDIHFDSLIAFAAGTLAAAGLLCAAATLRRA